MSLNPHYLAHETDFLVNVQPDLTEMNDMLQFCFEYASEDWNYYPPFIVVCDAPPPGSPHREPNVGPVYFWFADIKDMTLFRLRFDSRSTTATKEKL
jgi:hypothetical protein